MWGGGVGDQPPPFHFRHFSDFGVHQMHRYLESKVAVQVSGERRVIVASYSKANGGVSCDNATDTTLITATAAGCQAAGAELGLPFEKSVNSPSGRPAGCFWDRNGYLYFNQALETTDVWWGTGGVCATISEVSMEPWSGWRKWSDADGGYTSEFAYTAGVQIPVEVDIGIISLMAATCLADRNVSMVYPPIGPYTNNLIRLFNASDPADRDAAKSDYCPKDGCDFSLQVMQGGVTTTYMLAAAGVEGSDPYDSSTLTTVAINVAASGGEVTHVALLHTPNVETDGLTAAGGPEVLDEWPAPPPQCTGGDDDGPVGVSTFSAVGDAVSFGGGARKLDGGGDFVGATGESIEWTVGGCAAGAYMVTFDYFAGTADRPLRLSVDGHVVVDRLCFPSTAGWAVQGTTATTNVTFRPDSGTHTITLASIGYSGNNILQMNLVSSDSASVPTADSSCKDPASFPTVTFYTEAAGGTSCVAAEVTATAAQCQVAGAELGLPFEKSVNAPSGRPAGCFWDINGRVYFNQALETIAVWDGTGGVCTKQSNVAGTQCRSGEVCTKRRLRGMRPVG
jgi:hypothetical protein